MPLLQPEFSGIAIAATNQKPDLRSIQSQVKKIYMWLSDAVHTF